jgi:uncharacterized protein (UPF0216 family)
MGLITYRKYTLPELIRAYSDEVIQIVSPIMDFPKRQWHSWARTRLRVLPFSYSSPSFSERGIVFLHITSTIEPSLHRLTLLTWIGDLELAEKLWEEEKDTIYFWRFWGIRDFEDFLFRVIICAKDIGSGYYHPELGSVGYNVLGQGDAFKLSTMPLSELLKMDKPHFSSVDGLITVDFDKQELQRIEKIVPEKYQKGLRLPLILLKKLKAYESYKTVGTELENMLLQKLLKLTVAPFEKYRDIAQKTEVTGISMLKRRKFKTIYKVLPESSTIWLRTANELPNEKQQSYKSSARTTKTKSNRPITDLSL